MPASRASSTIGSSSTVAPYRCTGITQRTRGRQRRGDVLGGDEVGARDRHRRTRGTAPTALTASAVAMNELAGTITSSPGPISSARSASASASVPEETPDREVGLAVGGELVLECLHVSPERERALLGDFTHRPHQLLQQLRIGAVHARERDLRGARGACAVLAPAATVRTTPVVAVALDIALSRRRRRWTVRNPGAEVPAAALCGHGDAGRGWSSPNDPSAARSPVA